MSISSLSKIIKYASCVCTKPYTLKYAGTEDIIRPVEGCYIRTSMWYADKCLCCGQCCRNYNTIFSDKEYQHLCTLDTPGHKEYVALQKDCILEVNGVPHVYHEVPHMTSKDSHGIYTNKHTDLNCRWVTLKDGLKLCRIHTYRTITCGFPHMEFRQSTSSPTSSLFHIQFGRNHQLGCKVDIKAEPYNQETKDDDLYWLHRLHEFTSEYGIETILPAIIECVENVDLNNLPKQDIFIPAHPARRLFQIS